MSAYLFLWNPTKDVRSFLDYPSVVADAAAGKSYATPWICPSRQPQPGDVAYVQRTGKNNNGLFACGVVTSAATKSADGIRRVHLSLDGFLPIGAEITRAEIIRHADFVGKWMPMASGNLIPDPIESAIQALWRSAAPLLSSR